MSEIKDLNSAYSVCKSEIINWEKLANKLNVDFKQTEILKNKEIHDIMNDLMVKQQTIDKLSENIINEINRSRNDRLKLIRH